MLPGFSATPDGPPSPLGYSGHTTGSSGSLPTTVLLAGVSGGGAFSCPPSCREETAFCSNFVGQKYCKCLCPPFDTVYGPPAYPCGGTCVGW